MKKLITYLFAGLVAILATSFTVSAQVFDLKSTYSLTSDTVVNTATSYLTTPRMTPSPATSTTIWVVVTKVSGTVGGTITLQGSLDGTTFKAINTVDTQHCTNRHPYDTCTISVLYQCDIRTLLSDLKE